MKYSPFYALLGFASTAVASSLSLTNPSFEEGSSGWSILDSMSSVQTEAAHQGHRGLVVDDQDSSNGSNVRSACIPAHAGELYRISFDAKIVNGGGIAVYIQYFDESGTLLTNSKLKNENLLVVPQRAEGWDRYSLSATAPEGTAKLAIWIHSFNGNRVKAYFDHFELTQEAPLPLKNPDFENNSEGWIIRDKMSQVDPSAAKSGTLGLLVDDQDNQRGSDVRSEKISIQSGHSYQLDFDAKLIDGAGIAVYLQFYDAIGRRIQAKDNIEILRTITAKDWESHSLAATAPDNANSVDIWIHSFNGNLVKAAFDNFVLKPASRDEVEANPSTQASTKAPAWTGDANTLIAFEKKKPSADFSELKVLQPDGSAFRQPEENWEQARYLIQEDPEWGQWFEEKKAEVDDWIANNEDRAGWEAGWNHAFISPQDNSFLVWTKDVPGEDIDFFVSKTGDRVEITPTLFRAWVGAFRKNHASMLIEAAYVYHITEDPEYAEWVASQLDFYADHYDSWGNGVDQKKHSHLGYQSLDDAVIISRQIDAARLVFDYAGPERRQNWFENLFKPEAKLLSKSYQTIHNIATWQRATEAKIALLYDDEDLWKQAVDSKYGLRAQFSRGVTSDYLWYEQSMGYNSFIMMASNSLFTFTGLLGQGELLQEEAEISQNMMLAPLALRFPNNKLPNPADNTNIPGASTGWLTRTYRILPTYLGLNNALEQKSWETLIDPPAAILPSDAPTLPELPEVVTRNLESSRFALIKEGLWQIFFHYGQLNRSHAQAEALNWSASYGNTMISQDAGTVGYSSPMYTGYYRLGLAQNVPLINGLGQIPWKRGTLLHFDEADASVTAAQPEYRENASAQRTLSIHGDTLIDTTIVEISENSAEPEVLGMTLHLEGSVDPGDSFAPVDPDTFTAGRPPQYQYWSELFSSPVTDSITLPVTFKGGLILNLTFQYEGPFTLFIAKAPGQPPATHTVFYIETAPTRQAEFITRLSPKAIEPTAHDKPKGEAEEQKEFFERLFDWF
ncbi:carbohydrate binding domain-containing protein [Puniceicoccus vermicola]|uniref:Carbohydrate binding domain-containing protein n=1 Tax=Puniceicoccus vermicola TaxID=388746 RepID=A0A7X1B0K5_9BACT|nr:carbohydrate binding domain-containing protein [Puniceicoccus vermicola]MBC2603415.1 carbohydrate binding domain-containing protein [Puniceicoccus vermicola]